MRVRWPVKAAGRRPLGVKRQWLQTQKQRRFADKLFARLYGDTCSTVAFVVDVLPEETPTALLPPPQAAKANVRIAAAANSPARRNKE